MSNKTIGISDVLNDYILNVSVKECSQQKELREATMKLKEHNMQISPEQGQFMALLVKLMNAKSILEVGVFTGYSALTMAKELPEDGKLVGCDLSKEWTDIGKDYWRRAGVIDKIDLRLAPAIETLEELVKEGFENHFDMMFIDADKSNYMSYYQLGLRLVRPGGLIMIDNTLWSGSVAEPDNQSEDTVAIRELNEYIANDSSVRASLLPIADGLTLAYKQG
jgi:predicted O-methyltransferase YrrM